MSIEGQTAAACGRAFIIAAGSVTLAFPLSRLLAAARGAARARILALLLAPLLTPALLVSYAYSQVALRFIASPQWGWLLHGAALFLKLAPVAVLVLHFLPPPLSAEAGHTYALLGNSRWAAFRFRWRGAGRSPWLAGALVFLLAFSDFEMASLWNLKTWTVMLFDAQAGGLAMKESLRLAAAPLSVQVAVLALAFLGSWRPPSYTPGRWKPPAKGLRRVLHLYLIVAALAACAAPLWIVGAQAISGISSVVENFVLGRDLLASLCFAVGATVCAWPLAGWLARRRGAGLVFCIPGLLGALQLALLFLAVFQIPPLHAAYDTPLPLLSALAMLLLPFAIPLRKLLDAAQREPSLHAARLSGSGELLWALDLRRRWLAAGLLFCWAYFDFTAASILAPVGLTPVFVRLHNLMHYGQTAVLSAMLCAAFAVPAGVLLLTGTAWRLYARRNGR